jgi:hypothetical protein
MEQSKKHGNLVAFSLLALAASVFYRIRGHEFAYEASLISLGLLLIFYSLRFWSKESKRLVDAARYSVVLTWCVHVISVMHGGGFFSWAFLLLLAAALFWTTLEVRNKVQGRNSINELHFLLLVGLVVEFAGIIFKVQHWPGANIMLVMGVAIAGAGFVFNVRSRVGQKG